MDREQKVADLLGVAPIAKSVERLTTAAVDGAAALFSRLCLPAAEEVGLLLQDRVRAWRAANLVSIAVKTEQKLRAQGLGSQVHAHPRVFSKIIEEGSWTDDDAVQEMWAGLLTSACSEDGQDDSNLIFIQILSGLSRVQARILNYACEHAEKVLHPNGLINANVLQVTLAELIALSGESDIYRLDSEMDQLRNLGLLLEIQSGFDPTSNPCSAYLTPGSLALLMYVRCAGLRGSPIEFYGLAPKAETGPR